MAGDLYNIYGYNPSIPAAVIFTILFSITTAHHWYRVFKSRAWYFIPFAIGGIFQVVGYIFRALGHGRTHSIPIYALQTVFILLAPPFYAASIYMVLGRLAHFLQAESLCLIPVRWMTKIFVTADVISFLTQSSGGGLMSSGGDGNTTGSNITIVGLAIQIAFFGFFILSAIIFHLRIRRAPTVQSREGLRHGSSAWKDRNWVTLLLALYLASALILTRSVFRMIEFIDGYGGYLMTHEWFIYIFDALLMSITMAVMNVYHPSYIIRDDKRSDQRDSDILQLS